VLRQRDAAKILRLLNRTIPRQGILDVVEVDNEAVRREGSYIRKGERGNPRFLPHAVAIHRQDNRRGVRPRGIQCIGTWPDGKAKLAEPAGDPAASQGPEAAGLLLHRTRQLRDGCNQTRQGSRINRPLPKPFRIDRHRSFLGAGDVASHASRSPHAAFPDNFLPMAFGARIANDVPGLRSFAENADAHQPIEFIPPPTVYVVVAENRIAASRPEPDITQRAAHRVQSPKASGNAVAFLPPSCRQDRTANRSRP